MKLIQIEDYLLLIEEVAEIKKGDYILEKESIINIFPDYLTDLDECSKIIAYRKLNEEARELDLPWLPPFEEDRKEFIPEYEEIPNFERSMGNIHENYKYQIKTTTNSSGKIELVGTYKY